MVCNIIECTDIKILIYVHNIFTGEGLKLTSISVNGAQIPSDGYSVTPDSLKIYPCFLSQLPPSFVLQTVVELNPSKNFALSGLYESNSMLCTQCEAMGFRRITYHSDRYIDT